MENQTDQKEGTLQDILRLQQTFQQKGGLLPLKFRKKLLNIFKDLVKSHEEKLYRAIYDDFGKSAFETYSTELVFIYNEIDYFLKNLSQLAKPQKVATNLPNQMASSKIYADAYGCALIIGAWNYPYQLSLVPAICALAAGNTVMLKPSEIPENTTKAMAEMINGNFPKEVFHVVNGGVSETTALLKLKFDKIFFTGSPQVGKIVYQAAAQHLTPVTLELGGKSPALVTPSANLKVAARRIVWGKFLNAGQTCISPDYVYVHESVKDEFITEVKNHLDQFDYHPNAENYTRIINAKHFDRLTQLIIPEKVVYGGKIDKEKLYIQPTVMDEVNWTDKVMQEEIFGPIMPLLTYTHLAEAFAVIKAQEKPLSAYIFTAKNSEKEKFSTELSFGGGCINDAVMHIANPNLPFGGVGNSGMGSYHGKYGFEAFTHQKAVMDKMVWGEPKIKYPPYTDSNKKWVKRLM